MSEARKTAALVIAAVLLAAVTWALGPRGHSPIGLPDHDRLLFPDFADPNGATSLEVVEFDERTGTPRAFKVQNQRGSWTIPSHFDYPADAKDRLARIAAEIVTLRQEDVASVSTADYERLGVLDPMDVALPGVKGRATRVTIRGENERLLADILIGRPVTGHDELRYVRRPDQKMVSIARIGNLQTSTRFSDWIDPDLLRIDRNDIDAINIVNYSLDHTSGAVRPREALLLRRSRDDDWTLADSGSNERTSQAAVDALITNLVGLKITAVFPKPPGISAALARSGQSTAITTADRDDLARKGFYLTRDGRLLSNEGEVLVHTRRGVFYTLRFGEVASGEPDDENAASGNAAESRESAPRENRYVFITVAFDPSSISGAPSASLESSERVAATLSQRFAPWYYVISAESFARIRPHRTDFIEKARK